MSFYAVSFFTRACKFIYVHIYFSCENKVFAKEHVNVNLSNDLRAKDARIFLLSNKREHLECDGTFVFTWHRDAG